MKAQDEFKKISGLSSGTQNINIHAKTVSLQQKTLKNDKGETVYFLKLILGLHAYIPLSDLSVDLPSS